MADRAGRILAGAACRFPAFSSGLSALVFFSRSTIFSTSTSRLSKPARKKDRSELHAAFGGELHMFARSAESGRLRNWDLDTEPPSRIVPVSYRPSGSSAGDHDNHWLRIGAHGGGRQLRLVRGGTHDYRYRYCVPTWRSSILTSTKWRHGTDERVIQRSSFFSRRWARCSASGLACG